MTTIEEKLAYFNSALLALFDVHAPLKTVRTTKKRPPYITDTILEMVRLKKKARKKFLKTKTERHYAHYKDIRNYVISATEREKKAFLQQQINANHKNSRKLWKNLKKMNIHKKAHKSLPSATVLEADSVNNFFIDAIATEEVNTEKLNIFKTTKVNEQQVFKFREVDDEEVLKTIMSLKTNATGTDLINLRMIQLAIPHCLSVYTHIINTSLKKGIIPAVWKKSIVRPLAKKATPKEPSDLRPISILPTGSKILEKIVYDQLYEYASETILPACQSGFRKHHSTSTLLLRVLDDFAKALDNSGDAVGPPRLLEGIRCYKSRTSAG